MTHEETCGDSLIEIYTHNFPMMEAVVRWCSNCGAVVVDEDFDGRTNPGRYMPMKFPASVKRIQVLEHKLSKYVPINETC